MFPGGINPKQMKVMMKRMGIKSDDIDAESVTIHCADRDIVIEGADVSRMVIQGQTMYSITGGTAREQESGADADVEIEIDDDDVKMVAEQTGASEEKARGALEEAEGNIAEAIMKLKG
ncbi:MAG: hypothetical protein MSIBF_04910 [Candidatus Altiarchaeales archaeon IMC4]|nr:MAG: hypothetical protein MSIBF_04910 [Candidatus Altiarchaeales archaeon IMC4]